MTAFKIFLLGLIALIAVPAHGFCQLTLVNTNAAVNLNVNGFPTLDLRVERSGNDCGAFFITIDNGGAASYANRGLKSGDLTFPIQFFRDAGRTKILKDEFETSQDEVITGDFSGTNTTSLNFSFYPYLNVTGNQFTRVGEYSGNYTLKLFSGTLASKTLVDSKIVNFVYLQNRSADASLVTTGAGSDLVLKYNGGYTVSMSSLKGGRLKRVKVDGISPQGGARLPVLVGKHSDTISITVASRE